MSLWHLRDGLLTFWTAFDSGVFHFLEQTEWLPFIKIVMDRRQVSLLILREIKWISFYSPPKIIRLQWFSDDFRGERSPLIRLSSFNLFKVGEKTPDIAFPIELNDIQLIPFESFQLNSNIVGKEVKRQISKRWLQENKARQIFRKTNIF